MEKLPAIPGYKILRKIAEGGSATVYLAVDEGSKREMAIKVLKPALLKDKQYAPRFLKEAEYAAQLEHTHIVAIHEVGQHGKFKYIVMEYLKESLKDRLKQRSGLPVKEAFHIVKQVAKALAYAHHRGIIHRDIKPANILFRKKNTAVVVDFGLARALDATHITLPGMLLGTCPYMSPEQCKGHPVDHLSDIYSLGVILYEMLAGNLPYMAENTQGILVKHINAPLPHLPGNLSKYQPLIDRMMAKDKSMRIQDAGKVIELIDELAFGKFSVKKEQEKPHEPINKKNPITPNKHMVINQSRDPQKHVKKKKAKITHREKLKAKKLKAMKYKRRRRLLRVLYIVLTAAVIVFLVMLFLVIFEMMKNK